MRTFLLLFFIASALSVAQTPKIVLSDRETAISNGLRGLRAVPDEKRGAATTKLALDIRELPRSAAKLPLADGLSHLATEGDFGRSTLQEVATTLATAIQEAAADQVADGSYGSLAALVRYEGAKVSLTDARFTAALAQLAADDANRQTANFTLLDTAGTSWTLRDLKGKVVLVNFWATWCPPCRKEMPDLEALYRQFKEQGLVILAISDETAEKVNPFLAEHKYNYPVLFDPGGKVAKMMVVDGIPKSFVYDREGKLVAQAIDMRTRGQLLEMLGRAGLH